ncbi:hypothetical protein BKH44_04835 [Helicobacter sp. 13S00477-4]|nr:hypothetical protein BKH44_04835 [Helicobacter sp. 13S00477-4]
MFINKQSSIIITKICFSILILFKSITSFRGYKFVRGSDPLAKPHLYYTQLKFKNLAQYDK